MKKTFWTVDYTFYSGQLTTAWFDNKDDAMAFYKDSQHIDRPRAHTYSRKESIDNAELNCAVTRDLWERRAAR